MKNNGSLLLIALIFIFIFSSCKKEDELIKVQGSVLQNYSGSSLQDVNVVLQGKGVASGVYSSGYETIVSSVTSSSGSFSMQFEKKPYSEYRFILSKENYFTEYLVVPSSEIDGSNYNKELVLSPIATIHWVIKNNLPASDNDYLNLLITNQPISCADCCPETQLSFSGAAIDTSFYCKTHGNYAIRFVKTFTLGGNTTVLSDTINTIPFQTTEVLIQY